MATRWFVLLSVVLAFLDQTTKYLARHGLQIGVRNEVIPDFFRLTLNFNKGIAWGMLPAYSEYFTYFAIIMVLIILMIMRKLDKDEVWLKIALAFQMAGAIGNMADRLIRHQVTDFLDVTLFPNTHWSYSLDWGIIQRHFVLPYDWPIFNLADSFVVVGTVVLVIVLGFAREAPRGLESEEPEKVRAGLGTPVVEGQWGEAAGPSAAMQQDEGLVEIPIEGECEGLVPLEEVESITEEKLGEPLTIGTPDEKDIQPGDEAKLEDLSKRPEH